jgi:hypothetical protein
LILESQKDLTIEKKEKQRGLKVRNANWLWVQISTDSCMLSKFECS